MSEIMRCSNIFSQKTLKIVMVAISQLLLISVPSLAFALSTVNLTLKEGNAAELGQVPGSFTVTRTDDGNLATPIEVWVNVTGSAIFGSDFANPDAFFNRGGNTWGITINVGELSRSVTFFPKPDNLIEGEETIILQLTDNNSTYIIGTDTDAEITIADDVAEVTMILDDGDLAESGRDPGSFTVTRSANGNVAASIEVRVEVTGTASFGSDFANPDGFFNRGGNTWAAIIAAGELSGTVTFIPIPDNLIEGEETISVRLLDIGVAYTVVEQNTIGFTIADDVTEVTMMLDDGDLAESGRDPGSFTVTRSAQGNIASSIEVWVEVTGTAGFGVDFADPVGFFNRGVNTWAAAITAGELSRTVTFVPNFDNVIEGDETIIIKLLDIGVAYTVIEENTIEMVIADFVETVFEDSFEEPEP